MLSRKYYISIQKIICRSYKRGYKTWNTFGLASELADFFLIDNPKFNVELFLKGVLKAEKEMI